MWTHRAWRLPLFILISVLIAAPIVGSRADETAVLIVADDESRDTVPGGSSVFRTALVEVAAAALKKGITPKGAGEVLAKGSYNPKGRNKFATLVAAAAKPTSPVDFMVGIAVYVSVKTRSYSTILEASIATRSLALPSGKSIGNFRLDRPKRYPLPGNCERKCVIEGAKKAILELAREVGAVTAEQLADAK